jgi:hypothetical protein
MRHRHLLLAVGLATALASAVPAATKTTRGERDDRCVRLDGSIAELRLKLRMGYSAKEGRLYRQKLAALEAERKTVCR